MQVTPRGVQLHLGTAQQPHIVDTLVMSNLGYFQLKAAPGVYSLQLAPGRSKELYTVIQDEENFNFIGQVCFSVTQIKMEAKIACSSCFPGTTLRGWLWVHAFRARQQ